MQGDSVHCNIQIHLENRDLSLEKWGKDEWTLLNTYQKVNYLRKYFTVSLDKVSERAGNVNIFPQRLHSTFNIWKMEPCHWVDMREEMVCHCNISPWHLKWCWKLGTAEFGWRASERNHGHPFLPASHFKLGKTSKEMDTKEMTHN